MNTKKKTEKKDDALVDERIVQLIPAPTGLRVRYTRTTDTQAPVNTEKLVVALALVETDGAQTVRGLTLEDITGLDRECGDFDSVVL